MGCSMIKNMINVETSSLDPTAKKVIFYMDIF